MTSIVLNRDTLESRDSAADRAAMESRIEAYRTRVPSDQPKLIINGVNQVTSELPARIPEINAAAFNSQHLRTALAQHGALIVRDFFPREIMATLIHAADQVIDACASSEASQGEPTTYFNPPGNLRTIMPNKDRELGNTRNFHRESGSAMCVEAPSVAESILQLYEDMGLKETVGEYLGEAPCLTVKKWVLRRSKLPVAEAGWHQDGAFMGTNINSVNMWLPLNECGGETGAPGMDVVPRRLYEIASAEGAQFNWSISSAMVSNSYADNSPQMPVFNAGDAFFFDHFFLHRTQFREDFTKIRYAIETWFFGSSSFPKNQIPLAW